MIKIHKNDSIVDIIIKIKNSRDKEIILEFPFWHPVLHNYTSLRILKTKAWKKDLVIITNDKTAKKIWKKLWIKYSITDNPDLIEYNYSFFEYFLYTFKWYFREIKDIFLQKNNDTIISRYKERYWKSKIWYFISFLFIALFLLMFVFYFAVNKTYIEITPKIEVKTKWKNFNFVESQNDSLILDDRTIRLKKITKEIFIDSNFWTSGVSEESVSTSRWKVRLYNEFKDEIDLIENTRLQTETWIVYLLEGSITIPWSSVSWTWNIIPWSIEAYASSRLRDNDWNIIWSNWNIDKGIGLFLPWLEEEKDKVYAETVSEFKWWNDNYKKVLTKQDIENAKTILRWKLEDQSYEQVKQDIKDSNERNNVEYELFPIDWITQYSDFNVVWEEELELWKQIDNFKLWWSIKITTYSYNKEMLLTKLRETVRTWVLENIEEIQEINEWSLRIVSPPLETTKSPYSVKATALVEAFFIHNFISENNNYVDKLKSLVVWLDRDEAEKIIINTWKVSDVNIDIRPFFVNKISKIKDNIVFQIKR